MLIFVRLFPSKSEKAQQFHFHDLITWKGRKTNLFCRVHRCWELKADLKCCSRKYKKDNKTLFYTHDTKIKWESYKINIPPSSLLACRLIMPLAERLSSKFQIYPQSLASWPKIHFLDNFSVVDIISRHTRHSRLPRQPSRVFPLIIRVSIPRTSFFLTPKVVRQGTGECLETKVRKTIEV